MKAASLSVLIASGLWLGAAPPAPAAEPCNDIGVAIIDPASGTVREVVMGYPSNGDFDLATTSELGAFHRRNAPVPLMTVRREFFKPPPAITEPGGIPLAQTS